MIVIWKTHSEPMTADVAGFCTVVHLLAQVWSSFRKETQ